MSSLGWKPPAVSPHISPAADEVPKTARTALWMTVAVVALGIVGVVAIGTLGEGDASYWIAVVGGAALVVTLLVAACVGAVGFIKSRHCHSQKGMWMSAAPILLFLLAVIAPRL